MITPKLKEREGFIFKEAPDFYRMDSSGHIQDSKDGPVKSMEDINEDYKEQEKDEKKLKKKKKNAPSVKEMREYKKKLIFIHAKDVESNFPCAYPILGENEDDDKKDTKSSKQTSTNKRPKKKQKKE